MCRKWFRMADIENEKILGGSNKWKIPKVFALVVAVYMHKKP